MNLHDPTHAGYMHAPEASKKATAREAADNMVACDGERGEEDGACPAELWSPQLRRTLLLIHHGPHAMALLPICFARQPASIGPY